ncbi:cation:dicarboxylate symporter family transporter [Sediminitomix flava]|uniref:Na+/H+-dicarboxylate symporter n=1 Tax=Sediminitomix flava TaxID=379075 RepID=A0A315ZCF3_SEDFL|nr:cation:dicarboxylase symporter family transporter [Sediminitomix flava]PWJ42982.1 Na+/H+-dicarboxylate symporter [Sediminitomix flava]
MKQRSFQIYIVTATLIGIGTGYVLKVFDLLFIMRLIHTLSEILESIFLFITPWIIILYMTSGIMNIGKKSGRILWNAIWVSLLSSALAGAISFCAASFILPGILGPVPESAINKGILSTFFEFETLPTADIVTSIIGAILLGLGLSLSKKTKIHDLIEDFRSVIDALINKYFERYIIIFVFGNTASITYEVYGSQLLINFSLIFVLIIILQLFMLFLQYNFLYGYLGMLPHNIVKSMLRAYFTGFGTQSSSVTVPITTQCVKQLGVRKWVAEALIPLCANIHKVGDIVAIVVSCVGLMFVYGNVPEFNQILLFLIVMTFVNVISPGIPGGGGMAALSVTDTMLGFVHFQKILMISLFKIQDSFGTATNVVSDIFVVSIVDNLSQENQVKEPKESSEEEVMEGESEEK